MEKSHHNSKRTPKTGFLTDNDRAAINERKLSSKRKGELVNLRKGSGISKDLLAIVEDFRLISKSDYFNEWLQDIQIKNGLTDLVAAIEEILRFRTIVHQKIAVKEKKDEGRKFYLKIISPRELSDAKMQMGLIMEDFFRGLKKSEIRFIQKYIQKIGYVFPLQEGMEYTWTEVKELLRKQMAGPSPTEVSKITKDYEKRLELAWSMVNERLDPKFKQELRLKTQFEVKLTSVKGIYIIPID